MEKLFTKPQEFRAIANNNDYKNLYNYYFKSRQTEWETEDCPYGFTRASALTLLKEKGMIKGNKGPGTGFDFNYLDINCLDINFHKLDTKKRNLYITDEVWERLECIYKNYEGVNKQNVLDAFLRKALDDMGV